VRVLDCLGRLSRQHIVCRAHHQGGAEVRYLAGRLGKVRIVANVDSETQACDLEDLIVAPSIEDVFGDLPVGTYDPSRLANLGIGHGAMDAGFGYTYFDSKTGHEFSFVTGLTYNLVNPSTNYQNGIDWHLDWGLSQFVTKTLQIGAVGYFYDQLTPDSGCLPALCPFESRTIGIGPQIGLIFPGESFQTYLNVKGYWDIDTQNRASGASAWVTLAFSPKPPAQESASASSTKKTAPHQ